MDVKFSKLPRSPSVLSEAHSQFPPSVYLGSLNPDPKSQLTNQVKIIKARPSCADQEVSMPRATNLVDGPMAIGIALP